MSKPLKALLILMVLVPALYVLSILWRVSVAEVELFGRSDLVPLQITKPKYRGGPRDVRGAFGSGRFVFERDGERVIVWRQKINGFQHIYGSALAAFELGDKPSDLLFCGNEYMEATFDFIFDKDGIEESDLRDRRKDLLHNRTGREVGLEAHAQGLQGVAAESFIKRRILARMASYQGYIPHYADPTVDRLETEQEMGCPGLPPVVSRSSLIKF